jgi:hypothetical protein
MKRTKMLMSTRDSMKTIYSIRFSESGKTAVYTDYKKKEYRIRTANILWVA